MASDSQTFVALNYLARDPKYEEQKPFTCYIDLSTVTQAETSNLVTETIENIPVVNVRGQNHDLQLDQQGFEVVNLGQSFQAADFQDQQWMQDIYYPFISRYLVDKLGAKEAHVFEHQLRYRHPGFGDSKLRGADNYDSPVSRVHADLTPSAARARFERHWPDFSENIWQDRLRIVNVWRPLVPVVTEWPLALCDARSVNQDRDLRASDIVKPDYVGESYVAFHNPAHQWYYLREQRFGEAWLVKLFDSEPGVANTVLHTAINTGTSSKARKSCEVRVLFENSFPDIKIISSDFDLCQVKA